MINLRLIAPALAGAAALLAGAAQAASFNLDLTGDPDNFVPFTQDFPGLHLDRGYLILDGFDPMNPLTVSQGDEIHATVTFSKAFTVPASVNETAFLLELTGDGFPGGGTTVTTFTNFYLGGSFVQGGPGTGITTGQLASRADFFPPNNGPFTFDSFTVDFTIDELSGPATLTRAQADYVLFAPGVVSGAPEPGAWALMILGFGGLGTTLRSRRRLDAAARLRT